MWQCDQECVLCSANKKSLTVVLTHPIQFFSEDHISDAEVLCCLKMLSLLKDNDSLLTFPHLDTLQPGMMPIIGDLVQEENPPNSGGIGGGRCFQQKTCNISETGKIGRRLLLITNRKLHMRFRLVTESTTLDNLEGPLRSLFQNTCVLGADHGNLHEDRLILLAAKNAA